MDSDLESGVTTKCCFFFNRVVFGVLVRGKELCVRVSLSM